MNKTGIVFLGLLIFFLLSGCLEKKEKEYEQIAKEVSNELEYDYPDLVCTDFSNELVLRLKDKGWFAFEQTVTAPLANDRCDELGVKRNGDCLHSVTVLVLPIDSINGIVLTPEIWEERQYSFFGEAYDCQKCLGEFN